MSGAVQLRLESLTQDKENWKRTTSCHFVGYPEKSKGYRFYCPDRTTKFVETRHAVFLEDDMIRGSTVPQEISLEEKRAFVPMPLVEEPYFSILTVIAPPVQLIVVATPVVDVGQSGTVWRMSR